MPVQRLDDLSAAQRTILEEDTLERALPILYHTRFAQRRPLGPNEGKAVTFTRWTSFGVATTPLVEGEVPAGESLATSTVTITPERYGSYIYIGRVLGEQGIFNLLRDASELLGEQAALTSDTLARDALAAGGTAQIADAVSARTSLAAANVVDEEELIKARQTLVKNKARPLDEAGGNFAFVFHPDVGYDLRNDPGLKNVFMHAGPRGDENPLFGHSVADIMGIRFYETANGKIETDGGASTVDVYFSFLIGRGSYGIAGYGAMLADYVEGGTGQEHRPVELYYHPYEDYAPMNDKMSLAWVFSQQEAILNSTLIIRVESASSIGSN